MLPAPTAPERAPSVLHALGQRKMAALALLGFASGLPFLLTRDTLQAWLSAEGIDLTTLGLIPLVSFPYTWKWVWSPLIDRFAPPFLGRRRGWLLVLQLGLAAAIAAMALHDPSMALRLVIVNAALIAFLSASQDIAFDAYRADVLEGREVGVGASAGVLGYRVAMLVAGAAVFLLADRLSWPTAYALTGGLMGLTVLATLWAPEPTYRPAPPRSLQDAVVLPFREFFGRAGGRRALAILAFIVLYKLGDAFALNMATPFLLPEQGLGFTAAEVGAIKCGLGLGATIVGVAMGGIVLTRLGINRSLWLFGLLQVVSNLGYYVLALRGKDYGVLTGAIVIENFCAGLGTAAFVAFLISLTDKRFSATQFALLSSLTAIGRDYISAAGGALADWLGWPAFFLATVVIGLPGLLLLPVFAPWRGTVPLGAATPADEATGAALEER